MMSRTCEMLIFLSFHTNDQIQILEVLMIQNCEVNELKNIDYLCAKS